MRRIVALAAGLALSAGLAACGDDDPPAVASAAFCADARSLAARSEQAPVDFTDPDDLRRAVADLEQLGSAAPDDIGDDLRASAAVFDSVIQELEADPGSDAALEAAAAAYAEGAVEVQAATGRVQAFVLEACDVDLAAVGGDGIDDPTDRPVTDDPDLRPLIDSCFGGLGSSCDALYFAADVGSPEYHWADTCGGRFEESPGLCSEAIGG